LTKWSSTICRN